MRVFKELRTNGYVFFGKTKLDLSHKGVTVIQAMNLDARKDKSSTNGAGKSLLMGLIPEIFYDNVPSGKDVKAQKMKRAGGVTVKIGEDTFDLDRVWGSKKDFTITRNGKDTQVRTLALASERAQKIIGLSEEEFYTTAYIDVNRVHPLIRGTSAQRQDYFTSMFRLHDVDNLRKMLLQELREAETAGSTYKELVAQFEAMRGTTSASSVKALEAELEELRAKALKFVDISAKYTELQEVIDFADNNAKRISRVLAICKPKEIPERLEQTKKHLKRKRKALEHLITWEQERRLIKDAKRSNEEVLEKIKAKGYTTSKKVARKGKDKYQKVADELADLEREYDRLDKECATYLSQLKELDSAKVRKTAKKDGLKDTLAKLRVQLDKAKHERDHIKQFKSGVCSTCGQAVKARPIGEIQALIDTLKDKIDRYEKAIEYRDLEGKIDGCEEPLATLPHDIAALTDKKKRYDADRKAWDLLAELKDVPEHTVEKPDQSREELEADIQALETELETLTKASDAVDMYHMASRIGKEEREQAARWKAKAETLKASSQRLTVVEAQIEQEREKLKTLRKVRDKALTLKERAADVPIIKALLEVYSNKMLKKLMIQRYASVIQDQLNKFRSIMFSEDFTFELVYDTKFHILCHRRYGGKKVVTSDVRKLSGAEGRGFALLLLLAILTLIPKSRRLNFLVLDEADSNMGPDMLKNFQRFIPILNKVIPHVIVVTPKPEVEYDNARYFTIVKQNGRSKLMKGRVHSL